MKKKYFVNYPIGARGDFLINCLVEADILIIKALKNMAKIPPLIYRSAKLHGILSEGIITGIEGVPTSFSSYDELFKFLDEHGFVKLKIVANEPCELLDSAWFALSKVIIGDASKMHEMTSSEIPKLNKDIVNRYKKEFIHLAHEINYNQNLDQAYIDNYDFVINFKDLFNVKFLQDLHFRVNNQKIGYSQLKSIKQNIDMQERLSESPFYQEILSHYNNPIH